MSLTAVLRCADTTCEPVKNCSSTLSRSRYVLLIWKSNRKIPYSDIWFSSGQTWGDSSFNDSDSDSDSSTPFDSDSDSSHLGYYSDSDSDSNIIFMNDSDFGSDSDSDSYSIPTAALLVLWFWLQNYINSDLNTRPDVNIYKMIYAQKIKHGFLSVHLYLKNCWKLSCLFCLM